MTDAGQGYVNNTPPVLYTTKKTRKGLCIDTLASEIARSIDLIISRGMGRLSLHTALIAESITGKVVSFLLFQRTLAFG